MISRGGGVLMDRRFPGISPRRWRPPPTGGTTGRKPRRPPLRMIGRHLAPHWDGGEFSGPHLHIPPAPSMRLNVKSNISFRRLFTAMRQQMALGLRQGAATLGWRPISSVAVAG